MLGSILGSPPILGNYLIALSKLSCVGAEGD